MVGKAASSEAKTVSEYEWPEKLAKYKDELLLTKDVRVTGR